MYSVVLMAALTAGTTTPAWGWGCHGCHGGSGGCHGCHGGWGSKHGCHGGWGACYGGSGGCYGCYGGYGGYGLACYGCYGGCYGSGGYGWGCYGGGCYGGACYGGCEGAVHAPAPMAPAGTGTPTTPGGTVPEQVPAPKKEGAKTTSLDQARIIVELPAEAKLYVDGQLTKATSGRRVFNTPQLEPGQTYYYVFRAEVAYDGQTLTETKRVVIHGGDVIQASFRELEPVTVAQTATSGGQ